jgi:hypothetical protein
MRVCEREQEQKREKERKKEGQPPAALLPYVAMRDGS